MPQPETETRTVLAVGRDHFIFHDHVATTEPLEGPERSVPATTIHCNGFRFGQGELDEVRRIYGQDDVWTEAFLEALILPSSDHLDISPRIEPQAIRLPRDTGHIPPGPYAIHSTSGRVYSLLKLCADSSSAFVRGSVYDNSRRGFRWLETSDHVPVPSRLYSGRPDGTAPLRGLRFGVKDCIDIAGLETGCGSSCYRALYSPKQESAAFIRRLLSAGAIMVGKMRLCQFCDGQDPLERLEEITPTNPRGDGFQKPSASSSGSASGAASYPWLDFTIGTDTGGSIRHPAGVNGLYGLRPSHGSVESSGLTCAEALDTPGVFSRSAAITQAVSKVMTAGSWSAVQHVPQKPRYKLLYAVSSPDSAASETPKFFPPQRSGWEVNTAAGSILEDFVQRLEGYLGSERHEVCIDELWKHTRPQAAPEDIAEATGTIYQNIVYYELAHNVVRPFIRNHKAAKARTPFIEPITASRVAYGASVGQEEYEASVSALQTYASWINEVLLPGPPVNGLEDAEIPVLIYPQSWGRPWYRDELPIRDDGLFWSGFSVYSISYCSGCPDITVPVGEVPFTSKITDTEEYLPVSLSLLAPRGLDSALLDLLVGLEGHGFLGAAVQCGSRLWQE
ncbi:amidase signature domain-containing protein [Xylariomycetidae sp. FL0641]|nr:amidase signature domain-containing protein [Xylariomycetidae sp. FL0641]